MILNSVLGLVKNKAEKKLANLKRIMWPKELNIISTA